MGNQTNNGAAIIKTKAITTNKNTPGDNNRSFTTTTWLSDHYNPHFAGGGGGYIFSFKIKALLKS